MNEKAIEHTVWCMNKLQEAMGLGDAQSKPERGVEGEIGTLLVKLRQDWRDWGSPATEDAGVNECVMAFHCKQAADAIESLTQERDALREMVVLFVAVQDDEAWAIEKVDEAAMADGCSPRQWLMEGLRAALTKSKESSDG